MLSAQDWMVHTGWYTVLAALMVVSMAVRKVAATAESWVLRSDDVAGVLGEGGGDEKMNFYTCGV